MSVVCDICLNEISENYYKCVECKIVCCYDCIKQYILEFPDLEPHCLNCKSLLPFETILSCGLDYNEYLNQLTKIKLNELMQFVPEISNQIQQYKKLNPHEYKYYMNCRKLLDKIFKEGDEEFSDENTTKKMKEIFKIIDTVAHVIIGDEYTFEKLHKYDNPYIFPCNQNECKGFITKDFVCCICNTKFCDKCLIPIKQNHECKDEDIQTMNNILNNTKPCPKCCTRIFKISGCSQMFCTHCHTGFDWNTGDIITGNFHNPHYIEYLQTHNITEVCHDDEIPIYVWNFNTDITYHQRLIRHLDYLLNTYTFIFPIRAVRCEKFVRYLCNLLPEQKYLQFLKSTARTDKIYQFKKQIWRNYVDVATAIILNFNNTVTDEDVLCILSVNYGKTKIDELCCSKERKDHFLQTIERQKETIKLLSELLDKTNEDLKLLSKLFHCKNPHELSISNYLD